MSSSGNESKPVEMLPKSQPQSPSNSSQLIVLFGLILLLSLSANIYFGHEFIKNIATLNENRLINTRKVSVEYPVVKINPKAKKIQTNQINSQEMLESIAGLFQDQNNQIIIQFDKLKNKIKQQISDSFTEIYPKLHQIVQKLQPTEKTTISDPNQSIKKKVLPKLKSLDQSNKKIIKEMTAMTQKLQKIELLSDQTIQEVQALNPKLKKIEIMLKMMQKEDEIQNDEESELENNVWKIYKNKKTNSKNVTQTKNSLDVSQRKYKLNETQLQINLSSYLSPIDSSKKLYTLELGCLFDSEFKACQRIPIKSFLNFIENQNNKHRSFGDIINQNQGKLYRLDLTMNSFNFSIFYQLIRALQKSQKIITSDIHTLDLSQNHIESLSLQNGQQTKHFFSEKFPNLRHLNLNSNIQLPFSELLKLSEQKMRFISLLSASIESIFTSDPKKYVQFARNIRQNWPQFELLIVRAKNKTVYDQIHQHLEKAINKKLSNAQKDIVVMWKQ